MSRPHLLVTGGSGFIGRPLVTRLVASGCRCTVVTRHPDNYEPEEHLTYTDYTNLPPAADGVINLAGESVVGYWTTRKKSRIQFSRLETTYQLVEWMKGLDLPPQVFLSASAVGIYGHRPFERLTENRPIDAQLEFRALVCLRWEEVANEARALGVRTVNLRIGNVLDPHGGFLQVLNRLYALGLRVTLGDPGGMFPWISLEDTLGMVQFALQESRLHGPLNVTAPHPISQQTLAETAVGARDQRLLGRLPSWLIRLTLGEFSHALLDSQAVVPEKALAFGYRFEHPTLAKFFAAHNLS